MKQVDLSLTFTQEEQRGDVKGGRCLQAGPHHVPGEWYLGGFSLGENTWGFFPGCVSTAN